MKQILRNADLRKFFVLQIGFDYDFIVDKRIPLKICVNLHCHRHLRYQRAKF